MNTPLSWIKAYVPDLEVSTQEYVDAMTLSGTKVESYKKLDEDLDKIVVGKILSIDKHPNADKLVICQVQVSKDGETVQIVTGADNINEGDVVPVVLVGGRVAGGHDGTLTPGGMKIKKGKLRGEESYGMLCSIEELGSDNNMYPDAPEDGIYIFSDNPVYDDLEIGSSAIEALGLDDIVFEYEVTSNRVDCFSILGIAREVAATFKEKFQPPVVEDTKNDEKSETEGEKVSDYIGVEIKDPDLCSRFIAKVVKNIKIEPSPLWMQQRLAACGIRPINNIVDITNYVMEEYGQPMHAYDLTTIKGNKIVVRRAEDGDVFQTLDGQDRSVDSNVLMICDNEEAIGIAGIMGGEDTKITDDMDTLLLEAACFNGTNIRLSGKKLGLRTEAAAKFEKGLDPNTAMQAINRACQLIEELGAGDVVSGVVDAYPNVRNETRVAFDPDKTNKILGTDIPKETMIEFLDKIEIEYDEASGEVVVPSWRQDVQSQADLDEEVARFYGYDIIPSTLPQGAATKGHLPFNIQIENIGRTIAEQAGFSESMNYSFESPKVFDKLLIPENSVYRKVLAISNPLGEDYSIMKTTPINGMLTSLSRNYNRRNKDVRLYELANIYIPKELPLKELPDERKQFTLGMYGEGDFFDLKGIIEVFLGKIGLDMRIEFNPNTDKPFLHPGRKAEIIYDGKAIGYLGQVHPDVADNYEIETEAYIAVLDMPEIMPYATFDIKYEGIAKYPSMTRDISMVMKKDILAGDVEEVIRKEGSSLLESYYLFDVYEGEQIEEGSKSMAYSIVFRDKMRTLKDEDVNAVMDKILEGLSKLGIELRH